MVESGLESGINNEHKEGRCPNCKGFLTERITAKYSEHWICHNNSCPQVIF